PSDCGCCALAVVKKQYRTPPASTKYKMRFIGLHFLRLNHAAKISKLLSRSWQRLPPREIYQLCDQGSPLRRQYLPPIASPNHCRDWLPTAEHILRSLPGSFAI